MKQFFVGTFLILLPFGIQASPSTDINEFQYFGIEHFSWEEFNDDYGNERGNWVSEYGPRLIWGSIRGDDWSTHSGRFYRHHNQGMLGLVRYDGGLVDDPDYELKHYTLYTGRDVSRQWGYRLPLGEHVSFSPVATLGLKGWLRSILPKKVDDPNNPGERTYASATEIFLEPYAKLGFSLHAHFDHGYRLTFEVGQQRPLHVLEWHNKAGFLKPEPNWNEYAAIEFSRRGQEGFFARLDYQEKIYDTSDLNKKDWFQPESHEKTIGVTMGWNY